MKKKAAAMRIDDEMRLAGDQLATSFWSAGHLMHVVSTS
jgi:hypothetical protein